MTRNSQKKLLISVSSTWNYLHTKRGRSLYILSWRESIISGITTSQSESIIKSLKLILNYSNTSLLSSKSSDSMMITTLLKKYSNSSSFTYSPWTTTKMHTFKAKNASPPVTSPSTSTSPIIASLTPYKSER